MWQCVEKEEEVEKEKIGKKNGVGRCMYKWVDEKWKKKEKEKWGNKIGSKMGRKRRTKKESIGGVVAVRSGVWSWELGKGMERERIGE